MLMIQLASQKELFPHDKLLLDLPSPKIYGDADPMKTSEVKGISFHMKMSQ